MNNRNSRIFWCDGVRAVAILLVLLNHSLEFILPLNTAANYRSYDSTVRYASTFIFLIGRLGVPLFLFLTGFLILRKQLSSFSEITGFYKKNLLSMIVTMEVWILLIFSFMHYYHGFNEYTQIPLSMAFIQQVPYMQMWYVPFIVGVYLGIPFLGCIVKNIPNQILGFFFVIITVCSLLMPTLWIFLRFPDQAVLLKNCMYGIGYHSFSILYLVTGYFLGHEKIQCINKMPTIALVILAAIFFCLNWKMQIAAFELGYDVKFGYDQIFGFLASICLFILLLRIFKIYSEARERDCSKERASLFEKSVSTLAILSFAAYFLHAPLQDVLRNYLLPYIESKIIAVFVLFITSTFLTNFILFCVFKIQPLRKLLFNKR